MIKVEYLVAFLAIVLAITNSVGAFFAIRRLVRSTSDLVDDSPRIHNTELSPRFHITFRVAAVKIYAEGAKVAIRGITTAAAAVIAKMLFK